MASTATLAPAEHQAALVPFGLWEIGGESIAEFRARTAAGTVTGCFTSVSGHILHVAGDAELLTATVQVASIETGDESRDSSLLSDDFLAAAEHPAIEFASRRVRAGDGGFEVPGSLTVRGVTHDVSFEARRLAPGEGDGPDVVRVEVQTTIDRHEFGIRVPSLLDALGLLGHRVSITLRIVAVAS